MDYHLLQLVVFILDLISLVCHGSMSTPVNDLNLLSIVSSLHLNI